MAEVLPLPNQLGKGFASLKGLEGRIDQLAHARAGEKNRIDPTSSPLDQAGKFCKAWKMHFAPPDRGTSWLFAQPRRFSRHCLQTLALTLSLASSQLLLAEFEHIPSGPWADWVESDAPFFSSVLDARKAGPASPKENLTPRGLILNLGHGAWACFDPDLLRVSAIWSGQSVTPEALAPLSYHDAGQKTLDGQAKLPRAAGEIWLANGIYPGWQTGDHPLLSDPREPAPTPAEVGRGALAPEQGRFESLQLTRGGLCLRYRVAGSQIREWMKASVTPGVISRRFVVEAAQKPLLLVLGQKPVADAANAKLSIAITGAGASSVSQLDEPNLWAIKIAPHSSPIAFVVMLAHGDAVPKPIEETTPQDGPEPNRWPQSITTNVVRSSAQDAYVLDDVPLPLTNPWLRNVRLADVQFFRDGTAAGVTLDGDVWLIRGLDSANGEVKWRRFATGLHEPMSLAIRDEQIFVYDRNGIWRLRDTDGDGAADLHELYANCFAQTAETREFPSSMKLAPDGSFIISKGGQQSTTLGKHNGMVLRVSSDGSSLTTLGWGFRGPFIGVHPRTGEVTVSDQEGNYVPTTPLYLLKENAYHGFLSPLLPKEQYPQAIAEPLTWIPHPVNSSAITQAWLSGAKMGALSEGLVHFGYTRPEIFRVLINRRSETPAAAVISLNHTIEFPPINGAVNPADGQLYVAGFRGWGSTATRNSGLARLRYTGAPSLSPEEVAPMDKGVLIRFSVELDRSKATDLASYSIERWNYQRTFKYGSPHLKLDGTPGQEWMPMGSVYLSKDSKSIFIGLPDMKPVMQMRVGWSLLSNAKSAIDDNAYLTPRELPKFDPEREGFEKIEVDLSPKTLAVKQAIPASVDEGKRLYNFLGCAACHSTDGTLVGKVGPSWKGLFGNQRAFSDGSKAIADEAYLRQSITDPSAKVVLGFEKSESGMPNYGGVVTDPQLDSLILFIKTLR